MRDNPVVTGGLEAGWSSQMLSALRLGRPLAVEVPALSPGFRAFVRVVPVRDEEDVRAEREHWIRSKSNRRFVVSHREFPEEYLDSFDFDFGAVERGRAEVADEHALVVQLRAWGVDPGSLTYVWNTDDPT
jgi:hypothetical protein